MLHSSVGRIAGMRNEREKEEKIVRTQDMGKAESRPAPPQHGRAKIARAPSAFVKNAVPPTEGGRRAARFYA